MQTPTSDERRQEIYEEEKFRAEAKKRLAEEQQQAVIERRKKQTPIVLTIVFSFIGLFVVLYLIALYQSENLNTSKSVETVKPNFSDSERLNVSEPAFSTAGIRLTLNDTRPNSAFWVVVKIGSNSTEKSLLVWNSLSGIKSGTISIPFRDCTYSDAGVDSLASANKCKVTIGAKLKDGGKVVCTDYDVPLSEVRTSLANAAK